MKQHKTEKELFKIYFLNQSIITMLCQFLLCNSVNQLYVYPLLLSLPSPPQPSRSSQSTKLSSLCYTAASHQLGVYAKCYALNQSPSLLPCPHVHKSILCLLLYSCPANRFFSTIVFQIPYICINIQYLFFSF